MASKSEEYMTTTKEHKETAGAVLKLPDELTINEGTYSCFWNNNFSFKTKKDIISRTVEQVSGRLKEYWKLNSYIKNDDYTRLINFLSSKYFSYILEVFNDIDAGDLFLSNMEYEIIEFTNILTEDDISTILKINDEIKRQLQIYAHHEELVETRDSNIIMWSNGCSCWNIAHMMKKEIKRGSTVKLDATMVLVPYSENKIKKYLCILDKSPLYRHSFEAIYERGETPFVEGVLGWVSKIIETNEYRNMQKKYA
jgi:hypothetical protein